MPALTTCKGRRHVVAPVPTTMPHPYIGVQKRPLLLSTAGVFFVLS
nr:MAG TPA: hypothetical protein [Caudoviricetes sp.]